MAISPPSDIVLDVLNNADPSRLEVAQAKLKAGQATAEARRLASTDASFDAAFRSDPVADAHKIRHRLDGVQKKDVPETYRKFEAMVLQNFIKTMLPDSDEVYGKGATGEIWKGMMAEQIANEIARDHGIGIAEKLLENGPTSLKDKAEKAEMNRSDRMHMATQIIDEKQLEALDKLLPGNLSGRQS
ncbi:MAG: rod-binding protein [Rhizobiaceae bacterium]|nr:rod-binding protein [Rhizobiaceae bacterium]